MVPFLKYYHIWCLCINKVCHQAMYRLRNYVAAEVRRAFPSSASTAPESSQASSSQPRSVGAIQGLIGRIQHNVSARSSNPIRRTVSTPYRMVYRQQSHRKPVSGRCFTKDIVMVESNDELVPCGSRRPRLYECGLIITLLSLIHCGMKMF